MRRPAASATARAWAARSAVKVRSISANRASSRKAMWPMPSSAVLIGSGSGRRRCWKRDWVIDLDIQKFFDSVRWDLIVKAVEAHTDAAWVKLYVERWLHAPLQLPDGSLQMRDRGTPQGSAITPPTQWVTRA
ncbi:reverse transcriptase domain-containing protein [Streptomyces sp. NPDC005131]